MKARPDFSEQGIAAIVRDGLVAGAIASIFSGIPSTIYSFINGRDPLEASYAAGSILVGHDAPKERQLAAAVPVHLGISLFWGVVVAFVLPRKRTVPSGAAAGAAIAALDLGLIGPRFPLISALPKGPQIADHVAFGTMVAVALRHVGSGLNH